MSKDKTGNWFKRHKILSVIGVLLIIGVIASAAGGNKSSNSTTNSSSTAGTTSKTESATATETKQPEVSAEYKSALNQAGSYTKTLHMSKQGVYDQLVSEYGGKFTAPAAQYAIDNVKADWNANALAKAKDYQKQQSLSQSAIHDQLISSAGEKFTAAEADYAIQHLND
jgi:Host cell surface-exposed lipoprotein